MKKRTLINSFATIAMCTIAGSVSAEVLVLDIGGFNSWDAQGSAFNEVLTHDFGQAVTITGIGWDVNIDTTGFSWLSESLFSIGDSALTPDLIVNPGAGSDFPGSGVYTSGGIRAADNSGTPITIAVPDTVMEIEFFENFDDQAGAIDSTFGAGSTITIQYTIPTPGALALLGIAGLVASRRRH